MGEVSRDSLGDRQKSYEAAFDLTLPARMPVILRVDGRAFHSYTRGLERPFSASFVNLMNLTAHELCSEISGARLAYVQSDEISLLLIDYENHNTQAWMAGRLQKIVSVASGIASGFFTAGSPGLEWKEGRGNSKPAAFDCRAFVVPREDVNNYFLWRQQDATRNSVQMLARSLYSHKECHEKNNAELQEMCFRRGRNWNDLPTSQRRGRCVVRNMADHQVDDPVTGKTIPWIRSHWDVDDEIPVFSQDRHYIDRLVWPKPTEVEAQVSGG